MITDDFRYMHAGKSVANLLPEEAAILQPINIRRAPSGKALLLLHGFSSSPAVYRELLPQLTTTYDALVCPVLPGHAESIATFATAQASAWIHTAEQACTELLDNYAAVDVLGLSLGGLLACHLSQHFALNHLYLLAPALALKTPVASALLLAKCLHWIGFRTLRNRAGNLYTNRASELTYRQLPLTTIIEILTLIKHFSWQTPSCPTDVFLGTHDAVIDSHKVAERFASLPKTAIHWLPNSAHVLPLDGDIDAIVRTIQANQ